MFILEDVCNKLYIMEEKIEHFRQKLHCTVQKNNGDLLNPEVILVSTQLDTLIYKYTYLYNLVKDTSDLNAISA